MRVLRSSTVACCSGVSTRKIWFISRAHLGLRAHCLRVAVDERRFLRLARIGGQREPGRLAARRTQDPDLLARRRLAGVPGREGIDRATAVRSGSGRPI
jgi:hypothetical protein